MSSVSPDPLRVLVCAPIGRDSELTTSLLARAAIACHECRNLADVCDALAEGAGALLLTEEALSDPHLDALAAALATQPAWSDVSVLLFTGGNREEAALRTLRKLEVLRNVTLLDRPVRATAVVSTVQAALRGRRRQYELRDVLVKLHKARADAEDASRLKDEFLATVSHELRTPLNAIMGWVSMIRQLSFEPERVASALEIVERNAKAQSQIIADILDVSRMISGRVKLDSRATSLARVVLDALDSVRPGAEAKAIEIRADIEEGPVIHGDPERLQQVFWNVLSNACKFTPFGGRIDVVLSDQDEWALVRIADTGAGIAPEFLPYVFDRFRQADQTFTRSHGGLGLGLAIVKQLVEMHGGEVSVRSDGVGKGATFDITLPLARTVRNRRRDDNAAGDERGALPEVDLKGRDVLLVDDDEATRELLATLLGRCGARVTAVDSAVAALAELDLGVPSLMIADIGMPGQNGLDMMKRIRERSASEGGRIPALALSAYARAEDHDAALEAGFDSFVTKPAMPADILRAIEGVLMTSQAS